MISPYNSFTRYANAAIFAASWPSLYIDLGSGIPIQEHPHYSTRKLSGGLSVQNTHFNVPPEMEEEV